MGKTKQFIDVAANSFDALVIYKLIGDELEQDFLRKEATITQTPAATIIDGDSLPILESSKSPATPRKINWGAVNIVGGVITSIGNIPIGSTGTIQNLWETIAGDTGSSSALTATSTLSVIGAGTITTDVTNGVLTITGVGGAGQDVFATINADSGSVTASSLLDYINIIGEGNITTSIVGRTLVIDGIGTPDQDIWKTIVADSGMTSASSPSTVLQVSGRDGIITEMDGNELIIYGSGSGLTVFTDNTSGLSVNNSTSSSEDIMSFKQTDNKLSTGGMSSNDWIGYYDIIDASQKKSLISNFPGWSLFTNNILSEEINPGDTLNVYGSGTATVSYDGLTHSLIIDALDKFPVYSHIPNALIAYDNKLYSYDINEGTSRELPLAPTADWDTNSFADGDNLFTVSGNTIYKYTISTETTQSVNVGSLAILHLVDDPGTDYMYTISNRIAYYIQKSTLTAVAYGDTLIGDSIGLAPGIVRDGNTGDKYIIVHSDIADRFYYKKVPYEYIGSDSDPWLIGCQTASNTAKNKLYINYSQIGVFGNDNFLDTPTCDDFSCWLTTGSGNCAYDRIASIFNVPSGHVYTSGSEDNIIPIANPTPSNLFSGVPTSYAVVNANHADASSPAANEDSGIYVNSGGNPASDSNSYEQAISGLFMNSVHTESLSLGGLDVGTTVMVGARGEVFFHYYNEDPKLFTKRSVTQVSTNGYQSIPITDNITFVYYNDSITGGGLNPRDPLITSYLTLAIDNITVEEGAPVVNFISGTNMSISYDGVSGKVRFDATGGGSGIQTDWDEEDNLLESFLVHKPTDVTDLSLHTLDELPDGVEFVRSEYNLSDILYGRYNDAYSHSISVHAPIDADNTASNETSHADVLQDGDFISNGFMIRTSAGTYSIDASTYATTIDLSDHTGINNIHYLQSNITEVGVIVTGTWNGSVLTNNYVPNHNDLLGYNLINHIDWTVDQGGLYFINPNNFTATTDANAVHVNVANEFSVITEKTVLADNDWLLVEDSAAGFGKKKLRAINLPGAGAGISSAYVGFTDGVTSISANGADTVKLLTTDNLIEITIIDNDPIHGDYIDFSLASTIATTTWVIENFQPYDPLIQLHLIDEENPHNVDKSDVGLSLVPNLDTNNAVNNEHIHLNKELLDSYNQTNTDISNAINNSHTHDNLSLLQTYDQTNTNLTSAVSLKHTQNTDTYLDFGGLNQLYVVDIKTHITDITTNPHNIDADSVGLGLVPNLDTSNAVSFAHEHNDLQLLETYDQLNADISDAVGKRHEHSNLVLLESYNQTNTNLTDAVSKKHSRNTDSGLDIGGANAVTASTILSHINDDISNPHNIGKDDVGLSSVPNLDTTDAFNNEHVHYDLTLLNTYRQTEQDLSDAVSEKHSHINKTDLDNLTTTIVDALIAAGLPSTLNPFITLADISNLGGGDMTKATYDTNNNGKVDLAENSELVNNLTVQTAVPLNALFTDTQPYDHTGLRELSLVTTSAQVVDTITFADGHIATITTRNLLPSDIGAIPSTETYDNYVGWSLYINNSSQGSILKNEVVNFENGTNTNITYATTPQANTIKVNHNNGTYSMIALDSADVISDIEFDSTGHISNVISRTLSLSDLGYNGSTTADNYSGWNLLVNGSGTTSITSGIGVNFTTTGISTISKTGTTITIHTPDTNDWRGINDTPVLNNSDDSISSKWAYDHSVLNSVGLHTKLGVITIGTWNGTTIADAYIASASTWNNNISSSGVTYENLNANSDVGTGSTQVAKGDHLHTGVYNLYEHPSNDGDKHIPANGTSNGGKVLVSSNTAGVYTWETPASGVTDHILLSNIGDYTHPQIDTHIDNGDIHIPSCGAINLDRVLRAGSTPGSQYWDDEYSHPVGDGNKHVPANGIINDNKVLTSSAIAGVYTWEPLPSIITDHIELSNIGTNTHSQIDSHIATNNIHYTQDSISITKSQVSDFGTYNTVIGTDTDLNTSGAEVIDQIIMTDGVITSAITTRNLTLLDLGYTGATNANYITDNAQIGNGAGYGTMTSWDFYVDGVFREALTNGENMNFIGGTGISLSGTTVTNPSLTINHTNSITAGTATGGSGTLSNGGSFTVPTVTYNAQGHITAKGTTTYTLPTIVSGTMSSFNVNENGGAVSTTISDGKELRFTNGSITTVTVQTIASGANVIINHGTVARTNSTSAASPSHGGTFTAIDSITSSVRGHITAVNTKTITIPSLPTIDSVPIEGNTNNLISSHGAWTIKEELDYHTTLNQAHGATSSNSSNSIVFRNASGGFSAGAVSAVSLNITATTASTSKTTGALVVTGGIGAGGDIYANNFVLGSDINLKENIKPIQKIEDINLYQFNMKSSPYELRYGVIAQEVELVAPELIRTDSAGLKSVAYIDLLIAKISQMENRIKELEGRYGH